VGGCQPLVTDWGPSEAEATMILRSQELSACKKYPVVGHGISAQERPPISQRESICVLARAEELVCHGPDGISPHAQQDSFYCRGRDENLRSVQQSAQEVTNI